MKLIQRNNIRLFRKIFYFVYRYLLKFRFRPIWIDENYQEQEAYKLILGEIITAFKVQEKGGSFVLKLFEIYTDISIKMISILS